MTTQELITRLETLIHDYPELKDGPVMVYRTDYEIYNASSVSDGLRCTEVESKITSKRVFKFESRVLISVD
jgi:hypothetical protein